jgi:hypothetical protein
MNSKVPKIQLALLLASIAYFSTVGAGLSALYGGLIYSPKTLSIKKPHMPKTKLMIKASALNSKINFPIKIKPTTIAIMKLRIVCVTNDHGYVPLVVITIRSFPHSGLITGL